MSTLAAAYEHLQEAFEELRQATDNPLTTDAELLSVLTLGEALTRQVERLTVATTAVLQRRGAFAERGYTDTTGAVADLLGCDRFDARRRVVAAEQACEQVRIDGTGCSPVTPRSSRS
jgi:hypothetical protein